MILDGWEFGSVLESLSRVSGGDPVRNFIEPLFIESFRVSGGDPKRRLSEEGRRSGAKSYRDVSAEERQAIEGSATAWANVLQNDIKPSKPKQNKPVDKSRRLNPPSGVVEDNSRAYGNEPVQQEENSAGYDTQKSVVSEDEKTVQKKEVPVNANGEGNGSTAATPDMPMRTRHAEETDTSSTFTVSQNQQNVKENLKSIIIGGEKYYIADTPSEPSPKSGKKKKASRRCLMIPPIPQRL